MGEFPSAGANGDICSAPLPSGDYFFWTGMNTVKLNGDNMYGKGFSPMILRSITIESIKQGRDCLLRDAIDYLKNATK